MQKHFVVVVVLFAFLNYSTLVKSQWNWIFFLFADNIHARAQPAPSKQQNNFTWNNTEFKNCLQHAAWFSGQNKHSHWDTVSPKLGKKILIEGVKQSPIKISNLLPLSNYLTLTNALSAWITTLSRVTKQNCLKSHAHEYTAPILENLSARHRKRKE